MVRLLKRLRCWLLYGGHWFELKFIPRPTGRATNVKRVYRCDRCGHERDNLYGW